MAKKYHACRGSRELPEMGALPFLVGAGIFWRGTTSQRDAVIKGYSLVLIRPSVLFSGPYRFEAARGEDHVLVKAVPI